MYSRQILQVLTGVGERGISGALLSKHVYNLSSTLFFQPDLKEIQQFVRQYLRRNSRSPQSLIERTGRWGYYRLNTRNSADARQLALQFQQTAAEEPEPEARTGRDLSLSLFD